MLTSARMFHILNQALHVQFMNPTKREMLTWRGLVNKAKKKNREMHSLRCDLSYKLEVGFLPFTITLCAAVFAAAMQLSHLICCPVMPCVLPLCLLQLCN